MRRILPAVLGVASLIASAAARAQVPPPLDAVGNVGLRSVDVPAADLAPLESALDRAVVVNAAVSRGRTATLSLLAADGDVAAKRADARRAAETGQNEMKTFQLDAAQTELDKAVALWSVAHGNVLDPSDMARLYLLRAKLAQIRHQTNVMADELAHALPVLATKQLDATQFSPDAIALFQQTLASAAATAPAPWSGAALADIAKRSGLRWIVGGDVRRRAGGYAMAITVVDVTTAGKVENIEIPAGANLDETLEGAVQRLFTAASIPSGSAAANLARIGNAQPGGTPTQSMASSASTSGGTHPVPPNALPGGTRPPPRVVNHGEQPWYRRWYVWAAVGGAVGVGAIAAASSGSGKSSSSGPTGITLVITK